MCYKIFLEVWKSIEYYKLNKVYNTSLKSINLYIMKKILKYIIVEKITK